VLTQMPWESSSIVRQAAVTSLKNTSSDFDFFR
jgi:hypothetical protein